MSFADSSEISSFVIVADGRIIGPFDSPDAAAKWMIDKMGTQYRWHVAPMFDPDAMAD